MPERERTAPTPRGTCGAILGVVTVLSLGEGMQEKPTPRSTTFEALEVALAAIEQVRPLVGRIRQRDRDLGEQLRRALSSVALNLGEASGTHGGHRAERFSTASGSCFEARTGLRVAAAWGYVVRAEVAAADAMLDRVAAMLYRLGARR